MIIYLWMVFRWNPDRNGNLVRTSIQLEFWKQINWIPIFGNLDLFKIILDSFNFAFLILNEYLWSFCLLKSFSKISMPKIFFHDRVQHHRHQSSFVTNIKNIIVGDVKRVTKIAMQSDYEAENLLGFEWYCNYVNFQTFRRDFSRQKFSIEILERRYWDEFHGHWRATCS